MFFFETLFSALFPDRCVGCSVFGSLLCRGCFVRLESSPAQSDPSICSLYSYRDPVVHTLVKLLKYKNTRHAAKLFGKPLADALNEFFGEEALFVGNTQILIVPIPLARTRLRARGYNQSQLVAKELVRQWRKQFTVPLVLDTNLLEKYRDTIAQAECKNKSDRLKNLDNCFRTRAGRCSKGETVILVDDVATTGATLSAAKRALREKGFNQVYALTIAH